MLSGSQALSVLIPTVIGTWALMLAFITLRLPLMFASIALVGFTSAKFTCFKAAEWITISGFTFSNMFIKRSKSRMSPI